MSLCHGASLYLAASDMALAVQSLSQTIDRYAITHATLPPAVLNTLPPDVQLRSLRTISVGGEALSTALVQRWAPGRRLINVYGATEATVYSTLHVCDPSLDWPPPIGRPIANTRMYIVDEHGEPVPIGVAGELYIGGAGVARGYLNRPELTAERFIASPFVAGDRLYKTGDLARYLPDGNIEFVGRNDFAGEDPRLPDRAGRDRSAAGRSIRVCADAVVVAREDEPARSGWWPTTRRRGDARSAIEALRAHLAAACPSTWCRRPLCSWTRCR